MTGFGINPFPGDPTPFVDTFDDLFDFTDTPTGPQLGTFRDEYCDEYDGPCEAVDATVPQSKWRLFARDSELRHVGQIVTATAFQAIGRYCDLGSWSLTLPFHDPLVAELILEGSGISLFYGSDYIMGGTWTTQLRDRKAGSDVITFAGDSDEFVLADAVAHWSPLEHPDPNGRYSKAADVIAGSCEDVLVLYTIVNCGPGALVARRDPLLQDVAPSLGRGAHVEGNATGQNLIDLLKQLATQGGVGFRVVRHAGVSVDAGGSTVGEVDVFVDVFDDSFTTTGTPVTSIGGTRPYLRFETFLPADKRRDVQFSIELGSITDYQWGRTRPTKTHAYVGDNGQGVARRYVEVTDDDTFARYGRIEGVVDGSQAQNDAQLVQLGVDALSVDGEATQVSIGPVAYIAGARFVDDWQLGDTVSFRLDDETIVEQVRQVEITAFPTGVRARPIIAGGDGNETLVGSDDYVLAEVHRLAARIAVQERK